MSDINTVVFGGRMVAPATFKELGNNNAVANFSIASNKVYFNKSGEQQEESVYMDCSVFGKRAEYINKYGGKGVEIVVTGELKQRSWTDSKTDKKVSKIEIDVDAIKLFSNNSKIKTTQSPGKAPKVIEEKIPI